MNRQIPIAGFLVGLLILTAAPSFSQSAETAPQPAETAPQPAEPAPQPPQTPPQPVPVQGTIEAIDTEQRTVQVGLFRPQQGQQSQTITVPPDAQIYLQTEVAAADIAVGDILEMRSTPPQMLDLLAALPNTTFPPRLISLIGDVIALEPLTLSTGPAITITIRNPAAMHIRRWQRLELADLATGQRLGALAQQGASRPIASLIQIWPAPLVPIRPTIQPTIQPSVSQSPAKSTSKP